MKPLWAFLGIAAYWLNSPFLQLYLRGTTRTRVLVRCSDEVLVVKPWLGNGKWILPGGGTHKNEQPHTAVLRELREETGIQIDTAKHVESCQYKQDMLAFDYELFSVNLKQKPELTRQLLEIIDIAWVPASKLNSHNANPDVLHGLQK